MHSLSEPDLPTLPSALLPLGVRTVECALGDFSSIARGKLVQTEGFLSVAGCKLPTVLLGMSTTGSSALELFGSVLPKAYTDMHLVPDVRRWRWRFGPGGRGRPWSSAIRWGAGTRSATVARWMPPSCRRVPRTRVSWPVLPPSPFSISRVPACIGTSAYSAVVPAAPPPVRHAGRRVDVGLAAFHCRPARSGSRRNGLFCTI